MRRDLARSLVVVLVSTVALGLVYPTVMTLFAQVAFSSKANGSLISLHGRTVGSSLAAQSFTGRQYFHERPTAVDYNADGTSFSNLGPNSKELAGLVKQRIHAIVALEGPYNPGLTVSDIPVDAVTASASGIDPHISKAYAYLQAPRIASVRHLPLARVRQLIAQHVDGRFLGFFGEPGVNVLELNIALDQEH